MKKMPKRMPPSHKPSSPMSDEEAHAKMGPMQKTGRAKKRRPFPVPASVQSGGTGPGFSTGGY